MSHFVHFVEPVNEFGDDVTRMLLVSPGAVGGEDRVWLYAEGSDGGGLLMTPTETVALGERIAALGREYTECAHGANT